MLFQKGSLWKMVTERTRQALQNGSLVPVPTNAAFIREKEVLFFVRVLSHLQRKDEARKKQAARIGTEKSANPFLPPEEELTVSDVTDTHICILNKFNVVENHLLIVTRVFEDQTALLTMNDFEALWTCMDEYESLGFYNGGPEAGASQPHKHLQLVPLPLSPEGPAIPIAPFLAEVRESMHDPCRLPGFPFVHAFVRFNKDIMKSPAAEAAESFRLYAILLRAVGLKPPEKTGTRQSSPYCLLITRDWMLVVPRSREHFEDISLNALAFAGSFFVRNEAQLERLKASGALRALASVSLSLPG